MKNSMKIAPTKLSGILLGLAASSMMFACTKADPSFSLPGTNATFSQSPTFEAIPRKIDILWVIDNSGSMQTSQDALAQNFASFIQKFQGQQYDFHMAVTTTDAFMYRFYSGAPVPRISDGIGPHSGVFVMTRSTPNLSDVWNINAAQGINGNGDERAFQSFEEVLNYSGNGDFHRSDAFLAIINVSDEDDFSAHVDYYIRNNYGDPNIVPVSYYKNFLDGFAGVGNYSFNTISILDTACRDQLNNTFAERKIGVRYNQLADMTGGAKASLCDNFGTSLDLISDTITNRNPVNAMYKLGREPLESTLVVRLDGITVPKDATNGWSYDAASMTVSLHGTYVQQVQNGGQIAINYDPARPTN